MHFLVRKHLEDKTDFPQTSLTGLCSTQSYQRIPSCRCAAWVKQTSLTCLTALSLAHAQHVEHATDLDQRQCHLSTAQPYTLGWALLTVELRMVMRWGLLPGNCSPCEHKAGYFSRFLGVCWLWGYEGLAVEGKPVHMVRYGYHKSRLL